MWTQEMFGVEKPIIALLHLDALPGDPGYCGSMVQCFFQCTLCSDCCSRTCRQDDTCHDILVFIKNYYICTC